MNLSRDAERKTPSPAGLIADGGTNPPLGAKGIFKREKGKEIMMYRKGAIKRKNSLHSLCLVALALFSVACQPDNIDQPQGPVGDAVSFRTETLDNFTTRSAGYTTTGAYAVRSMGIYASYTPDVWNGSSAPNNFFDNLPVSRSSDTSPWGYDDEKLWPSSGKLSFFAYAPHRENDAYGTNKPTITPSIGTPTLQYTIASTHDKQVDLLIATPQRDQVKRDYVTMPLRHALTKIAFSARVMNPPAANVQIRVTRIELSGLYGSGSIAMDGQNRQWALSGSNNHTYVQTNSTGGGLNLLPLSAAYQSLTPTNGHLFLLPQALVEGSKGTGATITVTYETQVGTNTPDTKSFDLELTRAISKFNPGDAYNLMLTINNGVTFIVVPTPWDNTEVQADSKNRILNVTRIEANVYPGVATRIFFWSNQPKESVYVLPVANNNNNGYPGSTEYTVNNEFQNLSGVHTTTPAYTPNIVYPGFDGTSTETGEGYIDVLIKDKTSNPYEPELADGDQRHIWLNASGLTRNILLNAVVRGNPTTLPYVGTFHRWNETGERIVTWSFNGDWTATIDDAMGDASEVLIDNLPSPFMATGRLYGNPDKEVGDPEAAQLAPTATTQVVGTGRVYFRVGWKSNTGDRTTTRYARINVRGNNIGGTGVNEAHLYLRQGEADDFLMAWDLNNRTGAVKWSPYNLTVEGLTAGGSKQLTANRANARFVEYPTQAGGFYKWVSHDQAMLPTAYSPVGNVTFNQVTYNGFWYSVMSIQESCPPGYRRPNRGSIKASVASGVTGEPEEVIHSLFSEITNVEFADKLSNSLWGYYADGFFDRRKIENAQSAVFYGRNCAVDASLVTVGYIGRLFYLPQVVTRAGGGGTPCNSLFFPAAGYRADTKQNYDGLEGHYWTSSAMTRNAESLGWQLLVGATSANTLTSDLHAMNVRCVRDVTFSTTLPPYNETGVPTALSFDADARNATPNPVSVDALFVAKWNASMARDFRLYTETDDLGNSVIKKIAAKVRFRGTTATGNHDVYTDTFASALGKVGSSVTYDFNHLNLTWTGGTSFTFYVLKGWTASSYLGTSTLADKTVTGIDAPLPIVLSGKGRVVFTRITPPVAP